MDTFISGLSHGVYVSPILWGLLAGVAQVLGYAVYIRLSLRHDVEPNPMTWLMFAYGTAVLGFLEWKEGASLTLLILPIVCAALSIRIAFICWQRGTIKWPKKPAELFPFLTDISLTIAYICVWIASRNEYLDDKTLQDLTLLFLFLTNASTIVSFIPIAVNAGMKPEDERTLPWAIWTVAYTFLGVATFLEEGTLYTPLMLYPGSCVLLHGLMALLAMRKPRTPSLLRS